MLIRAYANGWFPMLHEDGQHYWHDPDPRAVFPLERIKPDRKTSRLLESGRFAVTMDGAFTDVMRACADPTLPGREDTWISGEMIDAYSTLHAMGLAASAEVWEEGALVGGIYGVQLGAAFFGESMFSRVSGAGKIAFHTLVRRLRDGGSVLFDTQYINPHTQMLGAVEIPRREFRRRLAAALSLRGAEFPWNNTDAIHHA
jgi:leucyl/phenylalanyl-tRNA--protein transferase